MRVPLRSTALGLTAALLFGAAGASQAQLLPADLPLYFVENRGQLDPRVAYYVPGTGTTTYFTDRGLTFALQGGSTTGRWVLALDFIGARAGVRPQGQSPTGATVNYFKGRRSQWNTGLKSYFQVVYRDLWPGIDLAYSGTINRMKYTFRVKPGADPEQIRLAWRGAGKVELNADGEIEVTTPSGRFTDEHPVSWQEAERRQVEVATKYRLTATTYGFEVGEYDHGRELVIDPAVLVYAGFLGGGSRDYGDSIAVDGAGNAYVVGSTLSTEASFPVRVGPDSTFNGDYDAFVAKVDADGTALIYVGFLGGANQDQGTGVAVDTTGSAYISGYTESGETSFPVTVGPDLTYNGNWDAFVAKIDADGTALDYCGYIGGGGFDYGYAIAVDGAGNAYATGTTSSDETSFPVAAGPDLTYSSDDAFVAKVNANGTELLYAGYIGGDGSEIAFDIAVDSASNAYVTGYTDSDETSFPVTAGPDLTFNGYSDAFAAKVNASGTAFLYAGYLGGNRLETGFGIAVDGMGNAYVTGYTDSDETSFPVKGGPDLTFNGDDDAFVAKVDASGSALLYAGYLGGSGWEIGSGIAVDSAGNACVTGITESDETSFPVRAGPDLTFNGYDDAFVVKVDATGTALLYSGYLGGNGWDGGRDIAVDSLGNVYVTGLTDSGESSFPATIGPDLTYNGAFDAFVAKVTVLTPQAQIAALTQQVSGLAAAGKLEASLASSLISKLQSAAGYLDTGKVKRACEQLVDFIKKVNEKIAGGKLAPADGQPLIDAAESIRTNIGC